MERTPVRFAIKLCNSLNAALFFPEGSQKLKAPSFSISHLPDPCSSGVTGIAVTSAEPSPHEPFNL
jgi:hypothetical protein